MQENNNNAINETPYEGFTQEDIAKYNTRESNRYQRQIDDAIERGILTQAEVAAGRGLNSFGDIVDPIGSQQVVPLNGLAFPSRESRVVIFSTEGENQNVLDRLLRNR